MQRNHYCLAGCGRKITWRFALCVNCEKTYTNRPAVWPDWLRYLWNDTLRERRRTANQLKYEVVSDMETD